MLHVIKYFMAYNLGSHVYYIYQMLVHTKTTKQSSQLMNELIHHLRLLLDPSGPFTPSSTPIGSLRPLPSFTISSHRLRLLLDPFGPFLPNKFLCVCIYMYVCTLDTTIIFIHSDSSHTIKFIQFQVYTHHGDQFHRKNTIFNRLVSHLLEGKLWLSTLVSNFRFRIHNVPT